MVRAKLLFKVAAWHFFLCIVVMALAGVLIEAGKSFGVANSSNKPLSHVMAYIAVLFGFSLVATISSVVHGMREKGELYDQNFPNEFRFFVRLTVFSSFVSLAVIPFDVAYALGAAFISWWAFVFFVAFVDSASAFFNPPKEDSHVRGAFLASSEDIREIERDVVTANERSIRWGEALLPSIAASTHFLIHGTSGSGKSLTLHRLMSDVLSDMKSRDCRALVYDAKKDVIPDLGRMQLGVPVLVLNPFDARSVGWQLAEDFTERKHAEALASILVPRSQNDNRNPFFSNSVRGLLLEVVVVFMKTNPNDWTLRDVFLAMTNLKRLSAVLRKTDEGRDALDNAFGSEKTTQDMKASISEQLRPLYTLAAAWHFTERKMSLNRWLRTKSILVLPNDDSSRPTIDMLNQIVFKRLSEIVVDQPNSTTRTTAIFIDELSDAPKLDGLKQLAKKGRSKGVCLALGFQSIEGLQDLYGEKAANEIADQCESKALLRVTGDVTSQWSSKLIGDKLHVETSRTESTTKSYKGHSTLMEKPSVSKATSNSQSIVQRATVLPSEFQTIPKTTVENGLTGYYTTGFYPPFKSTLPLSEFLPDSEPRSSKQVEAFVPRDPRHQELPYWTREDLDRLDLPHSLLPDDGVIERHDDLPESPSPTKHSETSRFVGRRKRPKR